MSESAFIGSISINIKNVARYWFILEVSVQVALGKKPIFILMVLIKVEV